jgi:hypothetical protein
MNEQLDNGQQTRATLICRKWVSRLGMGFNPDTRGNNYVPAMKQYQIAEYDFDMNVLWGLDLDPYEFAINAMAEWNNVNVGGN